MPTIVDSVNDILPGSIASFFSKSILGMDGSNLGLPARRVPFIFTSDKLLGDTHNRLFQTPGSILSADTAAVGTQRNALPLIRMAINPQSLKWTQAKRIVPRKVMDGMVYFHFTNSKGQNNDIAKLECSGITGNIDTRGVPTDALTDVSTTSPASLANAARLLSWHRLYQLTREAVLYTDTNGFQRENKFYMIYQTNLIPVPVTLIGFFDQVLSFEENVDQPFNKPYSFSFTIQDTSPSLDDLLSVL